MDIESMKHQFKCHLIIWDSEKGVNSQCVTCERWVELDFVPIIGMEIEFDTICTIGEPLIVERLIWNHTDKIFVIILKEIILDFQYQETVERLLRENASKKYVHWDGVPYNTNWDTMLIND